eukprot:TRINITY_DN945_c0_g1_i3.p1 TRINITY_DN945_c0_g1~~TRINITY_DN945_c0_g1_i3.p1  ORF type:complete len:129 (+),score=18.51 TRINITY_DN945_c0_g1_i3:443-829(+)
MNIDLWDKVAIESSLKIRPITYFLAPVISCWNFLSSDSIIAKLLSTTSVAILSAKMSTTKMSTTIVCQDVHHHQCCLLVFSHHDNWPHWWERFWQPCYSSLGLHAAAAAGLCPQIEVWHIHLHPLDHS